MASSKGTGDRRWDVSGGMVSVAARSGVRALYIVITKKEAIDGQT